MTETATEEILDFTSGATNAEEFRKKEQAARDAARGNTKYFSLKNDGDTVILRFMFEANQLGVDRSQPIGANNPHDKTTGWIMTKQHSFVDTKPAPKDKPEDRDWPDQMQAVCRRTPIGPDERPAFDSCYICDNIKNDRGQAHRPSVQMWASAVMRDEVVGTQELVDAGRIAPEQIGKRVIIDQGDWIDEVDTSGVSTGRKVWKRRYVIVNMSMANFFSTLTTAADYHQTILDRDYRITRKGAPKAKKVEYTSLNLDPYQVTVLRDGQPVVITYDLREPEIAALYADAPGRNDMLKIVSRRVSTAWYNRYFDTRVEVSWKDMTPDEDAPDGQAKGGAKSGPASAPPAPSTPSAQQEAGQSVIAEPTQGVTAEALAAMRARVEGGQTRAETPAAAVAAPAAPISTPAAPAAAPAAPAAPLATPAAPPLVGG